MLAETERDGSHASRLVVLDKREMIASLDALESLAWLVRVQHTSNPLPY